MSVRVFCRQRLGVYTLCIFGALVAACGGGGGTSGTNASAPTVEIDAQPQSLTVADGSPATFSVLATGASLSYQWRSNGVPIANATASSYALAAVQYGLNGNKYSVTVYNSAGSVTSGAATLTVTPVPPSIVNPPTTQSTVVGGNATFSVVATGTTPLTYQWNKNGSAVPGAQNATWVYQGAKLADDEAAITVTVSNSVGSITSSAVPLVVTSAAPRIITQPQPQTVLAPAPATFIVLAGGTPPLSFQWLVNGSPIAGAIDASYVTPATTTANSGDLYAVTVTNANGSVTSSPPAALTVTTNAVGPAITTQPQSASAALGASATFTVAAIGTAPLTYQWQANGANIAGATGASYTVSPVLSQDNSVSYTVVVGNSVGVVTSSAAVLTVSQSQTAIKLIAGQLGGSGNDDGSASVARFNQPETLAVDAAGDVFVADTYNSDIREITATGTVILVAGSAGLPGSTDGVGGSALFNYPQGIGIDTHGNLFVADTGNQTIRKIATDGTVTTIAGSVGVTGATDGAAAGALFAYPQGVAVNASGDIYIADTANNTIREIAAGTGLVSTVAGTAGVAGSADGPSTAASFNAPQGVAVDASGNIYVADTGNDTIRVITVGLTQTTVATLAGTAGAAGSVDATGAAARFDHPHGLGVDSAGNVYVADTNSSVLRVVTPGGVVSTLAGTAYANRGYADGTGAAAQFNFPWSVAADAGGNLYVTDFSNSTVRKVAPGEIVSTYAGAAPHLGITDGAAIASLFGAPAAATVDSSGNIYVTDTLNSTIRKITPAGVVSTLAGSADVTGSADGTGGGAQFNQPQALTADSSGNVYVADTGNNTIRVVTSAGVVTTLAGTAGATGSADGTGPAAQFNSPQGIVVDTSGNVFVADTGNNILRKITPAGVVTTVAGAAGVSGAEDGSGSGAHFRSPVGLAIDGSGNLYIADSSNYTIRVLSAVTGYVTTLAGVAGQAGFSDGTGTDARFNLPTGLALDASGNLYVMDSFWRVLRKLTPAGVVTTLAGVPGVQGVQLGQLPGSFNSPTGIAAVPTSSGVQMVVPDRGENSILGVTLQ